MVDNGFFSGSAAKDKRIASTTKKIPLSPIGSDAYNREVEGFIQNFKDDFNYRRDYDVDTGQPLKNFEPDPYRTEKKYYYGEPEMRRDYPYRRQFRYENWDGEKYRPGVPFGAKETDTKVAMDNLGGYAAAIGGLGSMAVMGANAIKNTIQNIAPKFQKKIEQRVNPEENKVSLGDRVGGFLNAITGTRPVAAGTLDANQQVSQVSERPKLSYVNPDAKTMSLGEIRDAFRPANLFGYKDKFGRFDDPGSPLARDRAETMQRVAQNFSSPITADARTIGQIRADQQERMRENARIRNESFQRGERVKQKSADVTYGTNMLSNPAFGFRDKMTDAAKAQYDRSAKDATEMARTDPSLGNVAMQTFNRVSGFFGGPQRSLESVGERQLRLANKEINRPRYQKEAYARKTLGITNEQLKARNLQQIRANAFARNQAFQNERMQRARDKAAVRRGENVGTGRDGGFGSGTSGQGMPSNPKGFSGYSRKSSPSAGSDSSASSSKSKGRTGRGGRRGGSGGGSGSSSKGGTGKGQSRSGGTTGRKASKASKSRTGRSRSQCDIRTKIDITELNAKNLMKDDLATVAYFVQELREK